MLLLLLRGEGGTRGEPRGEREEGGLVPDSAELVADFLPNLAISRLSFICFSFFAFKYAMIVLRRTSGPYDWLALITQGSQGMRGVEGRSNSRKENGNKRRGEGRRVDLPESS